MMGYLGLLDIFGQIYTQWTLTHILGPTLVHAFIFDICHFLMILQSFQYFSENGCTQKIKVFSVRE